MKYEDRNAYHHRPESDCPHCARRGAGVVMEQKTRKTMEETNPFKIEDAVDRYFVSALARDLMQMHEDTGISLDKWQSARRFVERFYGPIEENGA